MDEPDETPPNLWLGGRLRLHQPPRGAHRAGTDAALLSRLIRPGPEAVVVDAGAGTGAVGLAVARGEPGARILLVEREPDLAALAARNIAENGLGDRVAVVETCLLSSAARRRAGLTPGLADLVLTNPPFFEEGRHRASPVALKAKAHGFGLGDLDAWIRACLDILKPGGTLGLVHRADALPDCLSALARRFGGITVRPVHARPGRPAIRILVTAIKGSRAPFALDAPLVLGRDDGTPTPESDALHRGLPWPPPDPEARTGGAG